MQATIISGNENAQKWIIQANIPFLKLCQKAKFTYMRDPGEDLYSEVEELPKNEPYQRRIKDDRIKDIKKFIRNSIINESKGNQVAVIFPTAMLLATQIDEDFHAGQTFDLSSYIDKMEDFYVVDGQHRLKGMEELYKDVTSPALFKDETERIVKDYLDKFVFNCTLLVNFDLWEQAQVFADVNFNQTKVNKSLYFSIYGMNYSTNPSDWKRNHIFIAHSLVKFMNSFEASPLKGCIKMLGTGKGLISQAFLADALMPFIRSPRGIWYVNPSEAIDRPDYNYMSSELISFFSTVKEVLKDYWPKEGNHSSILCKTTGIGALVRLMGYIHQTKMPNTLKMELKEVKKSDVLHSYVQFATPIIKKIQHSGNSLFGLKGDFAGTGGKGLEHKLFVAMQQIINR